MINKIKDKFDDLVTTINFYKANPHFVPYVSNIFCKLGKHDYELFKVVNNEYVELECYYCGHKKGSVKFNITEY